MMRLIARQADWWNIDWSNLAERRELVLAMDKACAEVGRDPKTLRRTWFGWVVCAPTMREAQAIANGREGIVGTPTEVIAQLEAYIDLGIDYFMFASAQFPDSTTLGLLKGEVIPTLKAKYNDGTLPNYRI